MRVIGDNRIEYQKYSPSESVQLFPLSIANGSVRVHIKPTPFHLMYVILSFLFLPNGYYFTFPKIITKCLHSRNSLISMIYKESITHHVIDLIFRDSIRMMFPSVYIFPVEQSLMMSFSLQTGMSCHLSFSYIETYLIIELSYYQ